MRTPDGIKGFLRAAGGDDDLFCGLRAGCGFGSEGPGSAKNEADVADELEGFDEAAFAEKPGGKMAFGRAGDVCAAAEEDIQIGAGSGMVQHATVHGGGEEERALSCESGNSQEIIGFPVGQPGEGIRGARRDDEDIRAVPEAHMEYMGLAAPEIGLGEGMMAGDRLKGEGGNEFFSGGREDHIQLGAHL